MNNDNLAKAKADARTEIVKVLADLGSDTQRALSHLIVDNLVGLPEWHSARNILAFSSMKGEVDTAELVERAATLAKKVYLPRMQPDGLSFHLGDSLTQHSYGMLEPADDAPRWDAETSAGETVIVCPGLLFDKSGGRLGRGKAFYDRFLSQVRSAKIDDRLSVVGVCYGIQLVDLVPAGPMDQPLDVIVTEHRAVRCQR